MSLQSRASPDSLYHQHHLRSILRPTPRRSTNNNTNNSTRPRQRRKDHRMSSAILSAFPRPPTHIPNSPLPLTPNTPGNGSVSGSRPPTPSGRRTPGAGEKSFQAQQLSSPLVSSTDLGDGSTTVGGATPSATRREKRRSRGTSFGAKSTTSGNGHHAEESSAMPPPRMSIESTMAFATGRVGDSSPLESTFSHSTHTTGTGAGPSGQESRRMSHYENLRRSLYNNGGDASSSRGSHYSTNTGEGAVSTSGSSTLGIASGPGSAFSSRPGSFIGPGTPPLNVPLSASARLAALRAKRAGLGALSLNGQGSSNQQQSTSAGHIGWAGPPPTTPLPPIPTNSSDSDKGTKNNRRSVNLASPIQGSFPFPSSRDKDGSVVGTEVSTPTAWTFHGHRSNPSGATFGHGIGGGGGGGGNMRAGDHSRGSSFGSTMDGASSLAPSIFRSTTGTGRALGMGLPNSSVSTFGGNKNPNASTSSFGEDGSSGGGGGSGTGGYGHSTNYSISSAGTAFAGGGSRSPRESFGPGLAAIAALSRGEVPNHGGSPISQYSDPHSSSPSGKSAYRNAAPGIQTHPPHGSGDDDNAPIDIQKELEAIRREKADRRVSTASMLSNFSTRTTNTFRGAASRVMDVSPDEVRDDEAAELAGERLLGSVGDGLEGLAAFGKRRVGGGASPNKLGPSSGANSRPGSSRGTGPTIPGTSPLALGAIKGTPPSTAISPEPSLHSEATHIHSPAFQSSGAQSPAFGSSTPSIHTPDGDDDDADQTITLQRGGQQRPGLAQWGRRPSENDTIETFEPGVVGSGSTFAARLSAEMENRASNGSTVSSQHHLMMTKGSKGVPTLKVEEESGETSGKTPLAFKNKSLPEDASNEYSRTAPVPHDRNGADGRSNGLVNVGVWDDAPVTPVSGDFHSSFKSAGNGEGAGGRQDGLDHSILASLKQHGPTASGTSNLDVTDTPRQARSPSPSSTSYSHTTITPFNFGGGAKSTSSGKPSLDIDRPDSALSNTSSSTRPRIVPPALSLSRATPLSSETSLIMPDEEDDVLASPSAGRDRGNGKQAFVSRKPNRASEDFAMKMEKEMVAGGMGEFALLQEVTIREKRLKLALFGRGPPSTLSKPGSQRPQSMVTMAKKLPDSPGGESARADGSSSPELEDMIKKSRRSLNAKAVRRRRSTGAMATYGKDWRKSDVDLSLGIMTKKPGDESRRRAMDLDRSGVKVRDSVVLDLPTEEPVGGEEEEQQDGGGDSDSSIDLHTPLPRLMLRAGLLSPHSKILRPPTPEEDPRASWMNNKNGLKVPLDKRNTDKRKRRHRDGKLLREGIGLTTGLGWSDSEDEDAPSPLTRRLSTMTLTSSISRKASLASSMSSFATNSMASLHHLARSPSLPSIPAGPEASTSSLDSTLSSDSGDTSRHASPPSKAMVITGRSPYNRPPETPRPVLKPSATMSIIEHAQMLPTATLFSSRNHPLASRTFNYPTPTRRSSSPAGNSSQSSNGGVILPVTPDADLSPSLANGGSPGMLKDVSTPEDIQGVSGGTNMSTYSAAGTGLAGLSVGRGRSWTSPPSPTPQGMAILPDDEQPMPTKPRPAEVRYSGGNFSYPTNGRPTGPSQLSGAPTTATPATPQLKKPEGLRKPTPRGLQPLTLPVVVHAGGRLSPRAGTFALPSSPSLNPTNPTTPTAAAPKKSNLVQSSMLLSKSTNHIVSPATPPSAFSRGRSGSTGSSSSNGTIPFAPSKVSSRMPQPLVNRTVNRSRTLSGGGGIGIPVPASPAPPMPQANAPAPSTPAPTVSFSALPSPAAGRKGLGALKSLVSSRSASEATVVPKMLGVARTASAPGSPPVRPGAGKTGTNMTYRKSAGSAVEAATTTPPRSRIGLPPPSSTSRLVAPTSYTLTRTSSTSSLTPSVVGVAL
ncbi:hypothetical protein M408DRAFT_12765 [Serendipita vermifera MAFF 305830]|uniref:Uncharacterized protein n=1 Tax=Serendipita vermifera MAFF 305830 TaxID=933852 RepID=A0A0C3AM11_SERVB|nr:hypothetical protein M408DRAFT_12765 [Serendipita vermifera MAFF 305830]